MLLSYSNFTLTASIGKVMTGNDNKMDVNSCIHMDRYKSAIFTLDQADWIETFLYEI